MVNGPQPTPKELHMARRDTLVWVNQVRETRLGLEPLERMPQGFSEESSCPVAVALDYRYLVTPDELEDRANHTFRALPRCVRNFIWWFDCDLYPDLFLPYDD